VSLLTSMTVTQQKIDVLVRPVDYSQDNSYASYLHLYEQLASFSVPMYWLEGNHDKPAPLLQALAEQAHILAPCVQHQGAWSFILLNSTIPGETMGELYARDLEFLQQALAACKGQHVMVCLHH